MTDSGTGERTFKELDKNAWVDQHLDYLPVRFESGEVPLPLFGVRASVSIGEYGEKFYGWSFDNLDATNQMELAGFIEALKLEVLRINLRSAMRNVDVEREQDAYWKRVTADDGMEP